MERRENFRNITAWVRSNDSYEPNHQSAHTANTTLTTHFFAFHYQRNHWLQTGKETEINAGEETVRGSLFCLPSLYPSESKGPGKQFHYFVIILCKTILISLNYSTRPKSNLFTAKRKSIQHINFFKGLII